MLTIPCIPPVTGEVNPQSVPQCVIGLCTTRTSTQSLTLILLEPTSLSFQVSVSLLSDWAVTESLFSMELSYLQLSKCLWSI